MLGARVSTEPDIDERGRGRRRPARPGRAAPVPVPLRPAPVPAVQVAALAATGFVAGAATAAVVARRRAGRRGGGARRRARSGRSSGRTRSWSTCTWCAGTERSGGARRGSAAGNVNGGIEEGPDRGGASAGGGRTLRLHGDRSMATLDRERRHACYIASLAPRATLARHYDSSHLNARSSTVRRRTGVRRHARELRRLQVRDRRRDRYQPWRCTSSASRSARPGRSACAAARPTGCCGGAAPRSSGCCTATARPCTSPSSSPRPTG